MDRYLSRILESLPQPVAVLDLQGRFAFINAAAERLLDVPREHLINVTFDDPSWEITTVDGSAFPREDLPFNKVLSTGRPVYDVELAARRPDGMRAIISANAGPIVDENGAITGVVSTFTDITGRKTAERMLRESERRFRGLLESAQLVSVILNELGHITFANDFLLTLTGWTWAEVIGQSWFDLFVPPEERLEVTGMFFKAVTSGEIPAQHENEILTKRGGRRTVSFNNIVLRDAEGTITGTASIGEDITERTRAERALSESEARFRKVFEECPIGMAIVGLDYRYVKVNQRLCDMLGYTKEELTSLTFPAITHPDDIGTDVGFAQKLLAGEAGRYQREKRYIKKGGEVIRVKLISSVVRGENGSPLYYLSMFDDVTERNSR